MAGFEPQAWWETIRRARLFRVLAVYFGASYVVIQLVAIFTEQLDLPDWFFPGATALLLIGLPIVVATALVQSAPSPGPAASSAEAAVPVSESDAETTAADVAAVAKHWLTWSRALLGGAVAFLLLFGFAGLYVVIKDRGQSFAPTEAIAGDDVLPGVAVLPFSVTGGELEEWREGMVSLLSTNLDGAAGLRAINSRTVLARWDEIVGDDERVDEATSLQVAWATRARYALMGAAVGIGPSVRLTADVYDVESGERLGQGRVEGSPDSVLALVDRLSIEVIRAIVRTGQGDLPSVNLAGITTPSVPALKAYLEGEAAFRQANFDAAIEALDRAVETDSTFALAYYRLAASYGWKESTLHPLTRQNRERALAFVDRLPERQALLVRIENTRGEPESLELARDAVRRYPDDPEAWYQLGEVYYHGNLGLPTWEETDAAFSRAVELDPRFAPYRIHLIDLAFKVYDRDLAAERLAEFEALAPGSLSHIRRGTLGIALAYGDSTARAWAREVLDTTDTRAIMQASTFGSVDARSWRLTEEMLLALERRDALTSPLLVGWFATLSLRHGALSEFLSRISDPRVPGGWRRCLVWGLYRNGYPVPEERVETDLAVASVDTTGVGSLSCTAMYAADRGRWDHYAQVIDRLDDLANRALAAGDTSAAQDARDGAQFVRGYGQVRQGEPDGLALMDEARREGDSFVELIGDIHMELGNHQEAVRYYRAEWTHVLVRLKLARAYALLGELEKARDAYTYFVEAWADADPELQPMVEEAKREIVRLRGDFSR
jgi:serine/threonine-protein kinase